MLLSNVANDDKQAFPKLIVGLGNPGAKYCLTRHNAGVIVLEEICKKVDCQSKEIICNSVTTKVTWKNKEFMMTFPQTYMNLSGQAVLGLCEKFQIAANEIMVCYDCIDIEEGTLKLKFGGSSGGHRGLESIIQHLGTDKFARLRIGVGRPSKEVSVADFVLTPWTLEQQELLLPMFQNGAEAVLDAVTSGLVFSMNQWNNWNIKKNNDKICLNQEILP